MNTKTILYLTTDLLFLETAKSGGAIVQQSQLSIFLKLGYRIKILFVNCDAFSNNKPKLFKKNKSLLFKNSNVLVDEVHLFRTNNKELKGFQRLTKIICNPTSYYYNFVNAVNTEFLSNYLKNEEFDFIWAQWFYAGLLAASVKKDYKVFYVHHDWQYKLLDYKKKSGIKSSILKLSKKRIEEKLVKDVSAVVCVSSTDDMYLKSKGINSMYLTTTYDKFTVDLLAPKKKPSLVHLGSLNTTANRVGLKNFLLNSWDAIKEAIPTICLEVVGELSEEDNELTHLLKCDENIKLHSFVENLNTVIRPLDIHIIPWNQDTGTRTRLALILQYKQCLVARSEGVVNAKEIQHNKNALLSNSWSSYTKDIIDLYHNETLRNTLSQNSLITYNEYYTHESQLSNVESFIIKNR